MWEVSTREKTGELDCTELEMNVEPSSSSATIGITEVARSRG